MDASWTISELCERVAEALSASEELPGGKARAIPDERSIRYYTTLGLLDRATLRGRTAYYGARHLAQLVAIKKMQADGATLAEIQELLPAIDDARLTELTGVAIGATVRPPARRDFWRTGATADGSQAASEPALRWGKANVGGAAAAAGAAASMAAPIAPALAAGSGSTAAVDRVVDATAAGAPPPSFTAEHSLELAPGVRLTIAATRTPNDADADALRAAAAAVLAELSRRRLVTSPPGRQP